MFTDNLGSLKYWVPELILTVTILLVIILDLFRSGSEKGNASDKNATGILAVVGVFASLIASLFLWPGEGGYQLSDGSLVQGLSLFGGLLAVDSFAVFFKILFPLITITVILAGLKSPEVAPDGRGAGEFHALLVTLLLGMNVMASATDLLSLYLGIELVSLISYVLTGFKPGDRKASEAALKYVIYGGVSSGVMLFGFSYMYGLAGSTQLSVIQETLARGLENGSWNLVLSVAVVLASAGFGYKIAVVPFHMWSPDVYEGAPTPVTAFLSVGPKAAGFAALIRFFYGSFLDVERLADLGLPPLSAVPWELILGVMAGATMVVGNLAALSQNNIKRLLAYSSIAHAGYMLLGVVAASGSGVKAVIIYSLAYYLMNLGAFLVVMALGQRGSGEDIGDYRGLGYRSPVLAILLTIFLVSLTGLPPTFGFVGKLYLFYAVLERPDGFFTALAILGVLMSAVSLYYYARIIKAMWLERSEDKEPVRVDRLYQILLWLLAIPTLVFGLFFSVIIDIAEKAIHMIAG